MKNYSRFLTLRTSVLSAALFLLGLAGSVSASETVLSFSGTDSYVNLGMPNALQFTNNSPLTVEGWVYLNSVDIRDVFYSKNTTRKASGFTHAFGFYTSGRITAYTGSAWKEPTPNVTVATKRWLHVAFSFNGTNMTYYLDGASVGTSAFNFNNVAVNTVKLGGYDSGSDINGMKSDMRIWNHARSAQQVADGRYFRLVGDEAGLLGYWPMNEGVGSNVFDYSGNHSTGTVVNATWNTSDGLTLLPADTGFLLAKNLTLADIETGNSSYTISNEVDVADFPVPVGYDRYQITASGEVAGIDADGWSSTNTLPSQLSFTTPSTDTNITRYVWFTNSVVDVVLRRAKGEITYSTDASDSVVEFSPPASYVALGKPGSLQLAANHPLTIEGWVRFKSLGASDMLFCKNNATRGSTYSYMFGVRNSGAVLSAHTGNGGSPASTWVDISLPTALQIERWYHLAFAYDGTNLCGYVDGVKVGENEYNFGNYTAHTVTIGGFDNATDANALRSDVRLWDHARSTTDIAQYRNRRLSGMETGLLGYWPLNDWSATAVTDRTTSANHGSMTNAMSTFSKGFSLDAPPEGFVLTSAFTLTDVETASARFTNSNTVDVATFPIPANYDLYQVTTSGDPAALVPGGWLSTDAPPAQLTFTIPGTDANITLYAWFTNSVTDTTLLRAEGNIYYTEVLPVPNVRPTLTREMQGSSVVIYASDIDSGSTGGEANGIVLEVYDRIALAANPGDDQTVGESYVTLPAGSNYPLLLWLKNEAGNTTTSVTTCLVSVVSYSGTNAWTGGGYSDAWHDGANWGAGVPVAGQVVTVDSGNVTLTAATAHLASFTLAQGATLTFEGWESALNADEIVVNGTITHEAQTVTKPDSVSGEWVPQHRVWIEGSNLTISASGSLNADYKGYPVASGPGAPTKGGGYDGCGGGGYGGHGASGFGGAPAGPAYGDVVDPWQPGSGAKRYLNTQNGSGGGAIRIEMTGRIILDGSISARGQGGGGTHQPGGSGGGIAITCDTFQGTAPGLICVDGGRGNYYGGSGGGGRIALQYNPDSQAALANPRPPVRFSSYAWQKSITGTTRYEFTLKAQMGTLYMPDLTLLAETPTAPAELSGHRFWYTRLCIGADFKSWAPESLVISNCAIGLPEGFSLAVVQDLTLNSTEAPLVGEDWERAGLTLYAAATNQLYGAHLKVGRDLTIGTNTWIYPHTEGTSAAIVGMRVERNVTVSAGGGIDANEKGYMPQSGNKNGPGAGLDANSGGAYGGAGGGAKATQPYGEAVLPLEPGSPGGWYTYGGFTPSGRGGGAIHLLAGGTLTIDGVLSANGGRGWYLQAPGGSGGSIFLTASRVLGQGLLQANGGAGEGSRGPGGGGRIAIWYALPLSAVETRIATTNTASLLRTYPYQRFTGELQAAVTPSILAFQPQQGTVGFYSTGTTMIVVR